MSEMHFSALSDRWVSAQNNDAFCAEKIGKYHVFGVAEGLSDLPGESSASGIAISSLRHAVKGDSGSPSGILAAAVHESEKRIVASEGNPVGVSRGSTHLCACLVEDSMACTILDTGEGNTYLIDPDGIRVPRDQQKPGQRDGRLTSRSPSQDKRLGDLITHTLGEPHMLKNSDFIATTIRERFLLLSSGGLHDFVHKERIAEIVLSNGENVETSCENLLQEAQSAGSEKTITIVLVHGHLH